MRVGEVARHTGVGVSALRAWERRFGFPEPARSPSGQRLYSEADVERVAAVCRLVAEGLKLSTAVERIATAGTTALPAGEGEALLLHQAVQAADQGIWLAANGRTRYANRRMAELLRCSLDDLLARPYVDFVAPEDLDELAEIRRRRLRDDQTQRFEFRLRRADGTSFLADVSSTPLRGPSGAQQGAVSVVSDATARKQAESEARFRAALLDAIGEAVGAARPDGTIVYANPATEQLLGWRPAELIGQKSWEWAAAHGRPAGAAAIHAELVAGRHVAADIGLTRRDGSPFTVHLTGAPVLDGAGELVGVIGVFGDNTERALLEQKVRTQDQQAETVALLGARALRHTPGDLYLVLAEVVEAARRVLQSDLAALVEVMPGGQEMAVRASSPQIEEPVKLASGSRSLAGYAALAGTVVIVEDAARDRRFDIEPIAGLPAMASAIAAPVFVGSGVRGVLVVQRRARHNFSPTAAHFMQSLANVIGVALHQP